MDKQPHRQSIPAAVPQSGIGNGNKKEPPLKRWRRLEDIAKSIVEEHFDEVDSSELEAFAATLISLENIFNVQPALDLEQTEAKMRKKKEEAK